MSNSNPSPDEEMSHEDFLSALFANLVIQQTNMAYIFLGRAPHPDTGQVVRDFETARYFIDQLEMLAVKTKGNLDKREEGMLNQSLTGLRMAFVEAVEKGGAPGTPAVSSPAAPEPGSAAAPDQPAATPSAGTEAPATFTDHAAPQEEDSRKKFSKKY